MSKKAWRTPQRQTPTEYAQERIAAEPPLPTPPPPPAAAPDLSGLTLVVDGSKIPVAEAIVMLESIESERPKLKHAHAPGLDPGGAQSCSERGENLQDSMRQIRDESAYLASLALQSKGAALIAQIADIREVKNQMLFKQYGHPSFRSWCVANFGERLGCWLDDML